MSLISDNKKFIFFHLYKCGGTSFRKVITDLKIPTNEWEGVHGLPLDVKTNYKALKQIDKFNDYYKFTFIRNPFDFLVSTYFYGKSYPNHFMHNAIIEKNMTMEEFVPYYMNIRLQHKNPSIRPIGSNKVVTFQDWLIDEEGNDIMDYVGKLETMDDDIKLIFAKLNIPISKAPTVNVNPNRDKNYRKYYTDKSRAMVEGAFHWSLNKFNYTF